MFKRNRKQQQLSLSLRESLDKGKAAVVWSKRMGKNFKRKQNNSQWTKGTLRVMDFDGIKSELDNVVGMVMMN